MNGRRLTEIIGSFLLGGGCVAFAYELMMVDASGSARRRGQSLGAAVTDADMKAPVGDLDAGSAGVGDAADDAGGEDPNLPAYLKPDAAGHYTAFPPIYAANTASVAAPAADTAWAHGLVVTSGVFVRERPQRDSKRLGMLRQGARVRVGTEKVFGGGCTGGWRAVSTGGFMCGGAGLLVDAAPPPDGQVTSRAPSLEAPLPFEYLRVTHDATPFFHRLPTFQEQDDADRAGQAWLSAHGKTPMPTRVSDRPDEVPAAVKEYLNAGYYVTQAGEHVRSKRRFIRTNRGIYARKYQMESVAGSPFKGQLLTGDAGLPLHFIRRELEYEQREEEGSDVLVGSGVTPARKQVEQFVRRVRVGNYDYYEREDGTLIRAYAVARAAAHARPPGVGADERWVHVDLSEQTLVAYAGDTPVFATLVSTGRAPGMTPVGVFRIQSKFISTAMRDQPPEEDAYSIEDVPWTQYFDKNVALHGAFWHSGFGLVRSHGCVNLSPSDARWLFGYLSAPLPEGWHAVMPGVMDAPQGAAVVVTE